MRETSKDLIEYIIKEENYNKTSTELSEELEISSSTIRGIRKRYGINKNKILPTFDDIYNFYVINNSIKLTAEHFNIDRHTVSKILKQNGIKTNKEIILSEEDKTTILKLLENHSYSYVAKLYNISKSYIGNLYRGVNKNKKLVCKNDQYNLNYHNYFKEINSKDKAYFLGLLAADGCVYSKGNRDLINLTLHRQDKYMCDLFLTTIGLIGKESNKAPKSECYIAQISSKAMVKDLAKYNIIDNKTWKYSPVELREDLFLHYLRGYFDGDGSISLDKNDNATLSYCGNQQTMCFFKEYFSKNYDINLCLLEDRRKYTNPFYTLSSKNIPDAYALLKLLYHDKNIFYLKRKYEKAEKFFNKVENNKTNRRENKDAINKYKQILNCRLD